MRGCQIDRVDRAPRPSPSPQWGSICGAGEDVIAPDDDRVEEREEDELRDQPFVPENAINRAGSDRASLSLKSGDVGGAGTAAFAHP